MTYRLREGVRYRMPSHFGPSPGPRQKLDGSQWSSEEGRGDRTEIAVGFVTDPAKLAALLPPGFELHSEPVVTVTASFLTNLWWLAGRGYNIVSVGFPATVCGTRERVTGEFVPVLWESLADPILTGREELGYPKLWAEIPDLETDDRAASAGASWLGFRFVDIAVDGLVEVAEPAASGPPPRLFYKYVPRTGEPGETDAAYVTTAAPRPGAPGAPGAVPPVVRRWSGRGTVAFHRARWEQLPTLAHIVNALADLDVRDVVQAGMRRTSGADMRVAGQRIVS